jgi:hypothetical protein
MGSLKPGKSVVYERDDNGTVWARYHSETKRWIVGEPAENNSIYDYREWRDLVKTAQQNSTLRHLLEKTINTYRLMKT